MGAERINIVGLVIRQALSLSIVGVIPVVGAALALTRFLKGVLFHVGATDPVTFLSISVLFVIVALLASFLPAWRAANVDPMVAVRYE